MANLQTLLSPKSKTEPDPPAKWSSDNVHFCTAARELLKRSRPEEALDILYRIESSSLKNDLTILESRLARHRKDVIRNLKSGEQSNIELNRIIDGILAVIHTIEQRFEEEEANTRKIFDYLRQRYQNRLSQKLANRQPINLRRLPSSIGTSEETSTSFVAIPSGAIQASIHQTLQ